MRRLVVLLVVVGMGLLPGIASAGSHTYQSGPIAVPIPDNTTVFHDIVVPDSGSIGDLNVSVTLNHTWTGDLIVAVTHVDTGTQVILANRACGSVDNMSAVFDDSATAAVGTICPLFGTFRPGTPLSVFNGELMGGTWRLTVQDAALLDTGTLTGWSLTFGAGAGRNTCLGEAATMVGTNGADILIGTAGPDVIVGAGGDDVIRGLGGDDVICGGYGNDRLLGGGGDDRMLGGDGSDVLFGRWGDDWLGGGSGADVANGGGGTDRCVAEAETACETS